MTVTMQHEDVLIDVLGIIDASTNHRGELSPAAVVSIIDNLSLDLNLGCSGLPADLARLRAEAQARHQNGDVGYREDGIADTIVMCGLWVD